MDGAPPSTPVGEGQGLYVGQAVVVLVAKNPAVARDAVDGITIDYEPSSNPRSRMAVQSQAAVIHEVLRTNVAMRVRQRAGDVEAAFAQADQVIRQRYVVPRLAPAPMETRGVVAHYQPQENLLTVWNSTQAAQRVKHYLCSLLNQPEQTLRVVAPDSAQFRHQRLHLPRMY